ncbi:MAG: hypothetical protein RLZZ546_2458, partial [Bacteroidota bacterium]
DKGTGKQQSIRIEASTGLSKEEVERMKAEAAANADLDKATREKAETINQADALIFQTEKQLKDFGDKIPADKKTKIESALDLLKEAHKSQNIESINSSSKALNDAFMEASQDIYTAQQAAGGSGQGPQDAGASNATADDITDVEFEEVEDKK